MGAGYHFRTGCHFRSCAKAYSGKETWSCAIIQDPPCPKGQVVVSLFLYWFIMFICYVCVDVGCHSLYVTMTIQRQRYQILWICADTLRQPPGWVRSGGRAPVELTAEVHPRFSRKPTRGETLKPVRSSAQLVSTGRSLQLWIPRETWSFDEVPGAAPIRCSIAVRNHDFLKAQEFTSPGSLVRLNKTAFWDCSISKHSKHFNAPWVMAFKPFQMQSRPGRF